MCIYLSIGGIYNEKWVCSICGYVYEGESAPEQCPICKAPADKFVEQSGELVFADEHRVGVAKVLTLALSKVYSRTSLANAQKLVCTSL